MIIKVIPKTMLRNSGEGRRGSWKNCVVLVRKTVLAANRIRPGSDKIILSVFSATMDRQLSMLLIDTIL